MGNPYQEKTPGQLAEEILNLSYEYGELSDELAKILNVKDVKWSLIRDQVTSDKQADRLWHSTEDGKREQEIELKMKKIQRNMTAIKTYLNVKENEARNMY